MPAPCPTFGFSVDLEFRREVGADARDAFWAAWRSFLEEHGLTTARDDGNGGESCIVVADGTQATDSDRVAAKGWLAKRPELAEWRVSDLADVKRTATNKCHGLTRR